MKHLNPRQGITIRKRQRRVCFCACDKCETPKSPPGDYNFEQHLLVGSRFCFRVKHLNPRQGITTLLCHGSRCGPVARASCETPKSPPGDYNLKCADSWRRSCWIGCETPKSPPGDYNLLSFCLECHGWPPS